MKKLTIEQKASAYDNLIERLKDFQFAYRFSAFSDTIDECFPELKESEESEDEKIRTKLIENFKWFCGDYPKTSKWGKDDDLLVKDIITWLEKQGDQKLAEWNEEDEKMKNQLIDFILSCIDISKAPYGCVAWLKSLKQRIG